MEQIERSFKELYEVRLIGRREQEEESYTREKKWIACGKDTFL